MLPSMMNVNRTSRPLAFCNVKAMIPMVRKYMEDMPPAKPSRPSIRFMQLMIAMINRMVNGIDSIPNSILMPNAPISVNTMFPYNGISNAEINCPISLYLTLRGLISSINPVRIIMKLPIKIEFICTDCFPKRT